MKIRRRKQYALFFLLLLGMTVMFAENCVTAEAKWKSTQGYSKSEGGFVYHYVVSKNGKQCWITSIEVKPENGDVSTLTIPAKMDGKKVIKLGYNKALFDKNRQFSNNLFGETVEIAHEGDGSTPNICKIKKILLPKGIEEISVECFSGMKGIESLEIPNQVEQIPRGMCYGCTALKSVKLPAKLKEMEREAFLGCERLKKIEISAAAKKFETDGKCLYEKKGKALYWAVPKVEKLSVRPGTKIVCQGALVETEIKQLSIPASVKQIEPDSISAVRLKKVKLDKGNSVYAMDGQTIYSRKEGALVLGVLDDSNWLSISKKVKVITNESNVTGGEDRKTIMIPASVKRLEGLWLTRMDNSFGVFVFQGKKPPKIYNWDKNYLCVPAFDVTLVPKGSVPAYRKWMKKHEEDDCDITTFDSIKNIETSIQKAVKKFS